MLQLIYKLAPAALWKEAEAAGIFSGAPIDLADGFIHFSTAEQTRETAVKHFHGEPDLLLIVVDSDPLADALRWEVSRGGQLFPHLYRPLPLDVVRSVSPVPRRADGSHDFSGLLP
ncbi:MAG TPA: DUF952 domain-containing protein [Beijerinckiaceae bacterium]|nr:DUF952 domain-containing protein [Beijerinckiaceae bacterium]